MAACTECGSFTKYNGGLCPNCWSAKNTKPTSTKETDADNPEELDYTQTGGMSEKDRAYRYGMIKGRIAETLVQELFLSLGYNVFRYGMENTIPGIMELLRGVRSEVAQEIRRMPDFVIQNPKDKQIYFVEVKFRASGEFSYANLPKNYPYENAYIILVSKKHIKCLSVQDLKNGHSISPTCRNYLGNRIEFNLDKEVIVDFCKFAVQFFENV